MGSLIWRVSVKVASACEECSIGPGSASLATLEFTYCQSLEDITVYEYASIFEGNSGTYYERLLSARFGNYVAHNLAVSEPLAVLL